jgi:hypothetical protein
MCQQEVLGESKFLMYVYIYIYQKWRASELSCKSVAHGHSRLMNFTDDMCSVRKECVSSEYTLRNRPPPCMREYRPCHWPSASGPTARASKFLGPKILIL